MSEITAHQLFFSRIEANYSPEKRSGYQVVYSTNGITDADVAEITKRVQCYQTNGRRYQYFHTASDKTVITCSDLLPMNENYRTITDRSGRPGAFIAHCLVFSREDFDAVEADPFTIIDLDSNRDYGPLFVVDADEMIKIQQEQRPALVLPVLARRDPVEMTALEAEGWSPDEFAKLWNLTESAHKLTEEGRSLMMQSAYPSRVFDLLNLLLYHAPQEARWHCTFDTGVDGCLPALGDFWAIIGERRISSSKLIHARVDQQKIDYTPEEAGGNQNPKVTYYGVWFNACLKQAGMTEINRFSRAVQPLATAFEKHQPLPAAETINFEALNSFFAVHDQRLHAQLLNALIVAGLDHEVAQSYLAQKWNTVPVPAEESSESFLLLSSTAVGQIDPSTLANILYRWLVREGGKVDKWRKLLPFAEKVDSPRFTFLVTSRIEPTLPEKLLPSLAGYHKLRNQALQALVTSPKEFRSLVNYLFGVKERNLPTPPEYFVTETSAASLGEFLAQEENLVERLTADEWGDLVLRLVELRAAYTLTPLAGRIKRIKPQQAQAILALIKAQKKQEKPPRIAPELLRILEQTAALRHPPRDS